MKPNPKYDIFISYRRNGGSETAYTIARQLRNAGYRVFFDIDDLGSGKFNSQLYEVIDNCKDFVIILSKDSLDRCEKEDDWIRLETAHAIKNNKNIIPIMLRGFKFPETLPKDINELRFYQGVTILETHYYDTAIDKLKGLLKSKRGITWERYKKQITIGIAIVFLISGCFGYYFWKEQQHFKRLCIEQVMLMTGEFVKMNQNLNTVKSAKSEWDKYALQFLVASPKDTAEIRNTFINAMLHYKGELKPFNESLGLSDVTSDRLSRHGIKTEEIKAFYSAICPTNYNTSFLVISNLIHYAQVSYASEILNQQAQWDYDFLYLSLKGDYYALLGFLTTMPRSVDSEFYKLRHLIDNFPDIPVGHSFDEYESLQESIMKALENIITEMGGTLKDNSFMVELINQKYNQTLKDIGKAQVIEALARIEDKKAKVQTQKGELAELDKKLTDIYESALEKFELQADDEQWYMWGKVMRIATLATNSKTLRDKEKKDYEERVKIAESKGLDPSFITMYTHSITLDEKFNNIYKWLDKYLNFNQSKDPGATKYVPSAKQYFREIRKGTIPYQGILVAEFENNEQHPVLKVGDIVVERKGKAIMYAEDYGKLKDDPAPNTVKIIRFLNDKMQTTIETIPSDCKILVGFVNLKESE